ncbi:uncharacterized protein LOC122498354 isoform X2 [Leptopilina heterotoma]|uniref:uncharacterized protein LOC122498354 isoform X2 n=1 Tax=Leptopilina heterotoma TaxID=63436 RepID=UPI001CAA3732|nr:uncharacterized protein LOC122498354 isoform X2 [Leptopilina heterotoma]XP_043461995.1 uncharacterized protein LOC122498354 isoform X2 [Leptopilina heterotoma]
MMMTVHRTVQIDCDNKYIYTNNTDSDNKDIQKSTEEQESTLSESGPGTNNTMTNSKRARKKRREAQQEFNHSWMVGALKGHTAPVRDINFSSNGKFLASCAEDCGLAPEEKLDLVKSSTIIKASEISSSSSSTSSLSSSSSAKELREDRAPLSRRQRKNLTRATREQRREHQERDADHNVSPSDSPILPRNRHHWLQRQDRHYQDAPKKPNPKVIKKKDSHHHHHQKDNKKTKTKDTTENSNSCNSSKPTSVLTENSSSKHLKIYTSMVRYQLRHLQNFDIEYLLQHYVLNEGQLLHGSYPVMQKSDCNSVMICSFSRHHHCTTLHSLNANAREFVPKKIFHNSWKVKENEMDSGNGSGSSLENSDLEQESSSDSDKNSDIGESSSSSSNLSLSSSSSSSVDSSARNIVPCILPGPVIHKEIATNEIERRCSRCSQPFRVDSRNGDYLAVEKCVHHWGKRRFGSWECCSRDTDDTTVGCITASTHVWSGIIAEATNGPFDGFVSTQPAPFGPENGYGVYAIDCEMCFTKNGLEVTKVSVVSLNGTLIYDQYVKPAEKIIDFNTRFSGITEQQLHGVTKTLQDVQHDLLQFIYAESILIGHGLENDLRVLRIVHKKAVDTSIAFLHDASFLSRKSLKFLAHHFLNKSIQANSHDSAEDARVAMDLMLRRVQYDYYGV